MILHWIEVAALSVLVMFTLRSFPPYEWLRRKVKFIDLVSECDFCMGVWVDTFLLWLFGIEVVQTVPVLSQLLSGVVTSFLVWLAIIGWKNKFGVFEVK